MHHLRILGQILVLSFLAACGATEEEAAEPREEPVAQTTPEEPTTETTEEDTWEPPPYGYEIMEPAERDRICAESGELPSHSECTEDTDCRICHDGSSCGVPVNLDELRRRGAACQQEDAAECEYAAVRCCEGRCKVVSH